MSIPSAPKWMASLTKIRIVNFSVSQAPSFSIPGSKTPKASSPNKHSPFSARTMQNGLSASHPHPLTASTHSAYQDVSRDSTNEDYQLDFLDELCDPSQSHRHDKEEGPLLPTPSQLPLRSPNGGFSVRNPAKSYSFLARTCQNIITWSRGPVPPRFYRIQSSQWLQDACDRLLDKCLPAQWLKLCALLLLYLMWIGVFAFATPTSSREHSINCISFQGLSSVPRTSPSQ